MNVEGDGSALNLASTDRRLRRFATRRPEWFAVLTCVVYSLPPLAIALLRQEQDQSVTASPVLLAEIAWCVLVPAVLLTALGWWGTAGFTRRSTWRSLIPFLPLVVLFVVPAALPLLSGAGIASHRPGDFALAVVTMLALGFGEEATFRGVVLQTVLPRGVMRAVLLSSVLDGAANIGNLARDRDPLLVGVYVMLTVAMGIAYAAAVVVTGTIWPLVVITASHLYLAYAIQTSPDGTPAATDTGLLVFGLIVSALAAAYGIWLLHRHQHRRADHSGEDDQASAPQEPPAA